MKKKSAPTQQDLRRVMDSAQAIGLRAIPDRVLYHLIKFAVAGHAYAQESGVNPCDPQNSLYFASSWRGLGIIAESMASPAMREKCDEIEKLYQVIYANYLKGSVQ
jgi:hypothetical protein